MVKINRANLAHLSDDDVAQLYHKELGITLDALSKLVFELHTLKVGKITSGLDVTAFVTLISSYMGPLTDSAVRAAIMSEEIYHRKVALLKRIKEETQTEQENSDFLLWRKAKYGKIE